MRLSLLLAGVLLAGAVGTAAADPAPAPTPTAQPTFVKKIVGKGKDKKVVWVAVGDVDVKASNKPAVIVVTGNPRNVVGRPKSSDRLDGLSHQLK
jgi:hypothetical protein